MEGLFRGVLAGSRYRFEQVRVFDGAPENESFYSLQIDGQRRLWAAGRGGLACLDGSKWNRYTVREGLLDNFAAYLAVGPDQSIWLGYRGGFGVTRLQLSGERLELKHYL
jgi:ligand-binding sensor domain-containing protein